MLAGKKWWVCALGGCQILQRNLVISENSCPPILMLAWPTVQFSLYNIDCIYLESPDKR